MVTGITKPGVWLVSINGDDISLVRQMFSLVSSHGLVSLDQVRPEIRLTRADAGPAPGTTNTINLLGIPLPVTTLTSANFGFTARSDFGIAHFECSLNNSPPEPCGSASGRTTETGTKSFPSVNGGQNTFHVTAIDRANKRLSVSFGWYVCTGTQEEVNTCLQLHEAVWRASFEVLCPGDCKLPTADELVKKIREFHPEYTNITSTDINDLLKTGILTNETANISSNNFTSELKAKG